MKKSLQSHYRIILRDGLYLRRMKGTKLFRPTAVESKASPFLKMSDARAMMYTLDSGEWPDAKIDFVKGKRIVHDFIWRRDSDSNPVTSTYPGSHAAYLAARNRVMSCLDSSPSYEAEAGVLGGLSSLSSRTFYRVYRSLQAARADLPQITVRPRLICAEDDTAAEAVASAPRRSRRRK